ncbi:sugar-phosphatase [Fructilactobacillus fructivorans]|uniref:Sugar-phosphatase n=1 Tax=Fructilactobacillus fructivorans TaxID=1614 RepID=A0AAE6P2Z6_9LACO|nr:sugar-phosphatase [Fructilactobacillus fructivorans]KRK57385.1 Cof-like hydrolase [Fructilactobacillus fructivorans]KRN12469.1 Cof-like hydrolase [Fructilactobacillus fructivorans]KRN41037.1 Cof-like hydrolase [Fructilactobacillus fructivorans]QFX93068.1 sugar-phosphatase [Fructilactobacillus fructivorans]RDV64686.1 sugar-phosphatase [Fructilactobacillus fructivorans]
MDIKLIAIDIDGTLLNEKNQLAPATIEAITEARQRGIKVALCTGRPITGVKPYLNKLGIDGNDEYAITYNGALVETVDGKVLSKETVKYDDFLEIEMMSREMGVHFQIETVDSITTTDRDISPFSVEESHLVSMPIKYRTPGEITRDVNIYKLMYVDYPDKITKAKGNLPKSIYERMSVVQSSPVFLEFMNSNSSKGNALKALSEQLGLKPDNVMAIGDQGNDLSMIKFAGLGVSMGNGIEEIKKNAQFVTKPNSEDGVAYAINKYVNQ